MAGESYFNVASIVFVNPAGMLIFQKRDNKQGIRNPNAITAWGGACEGPESPLQAAMREVGEETNLTPHETDYEFFGTYPRDYKIDGKQVMNHVFLLRDIDEHTVEVYEGQGWVLVDPADQTDNPLYTELTRELIIDYSAKER